MKWKKIILAMLFLALIIVAIVSYSTLNQPIKKVTKTDTLSETQCQGELCNSYVEMLCQDNNCNSELLQYYLQLQTKVVQCLENHFQFSAPRVIYKISSIEKPECEQEEGCCCTTGGSTSWSGISQSNLFGNTQFGEKVAKDLSDIIAEEHETTHFFLYYMLRGHPNWFSEAIAIEVNERVNCDVVAMDLEGNAKEFAKKGDAYLRETGTDLLSSGGIRMDDGSMLDNNYYLRLKQGDVSLSEREKRDSHTIGALWIMGLKEDYNCNEQCVLRIVKELQGYTSSQCRPGTSCGDNPLQFPEIITNEIIKEKTDLIIGSDTGELFRLLEIS
ncbi:MAG: hypothetical protein Q8Q01_00125 [archaeon]|nr:hypothetical protein [archaeon]